jgi:hypothetical protein
LELHFAQGLRFSGFQDNVCEGETIPLRLTQAQGSRPGCLELAEESEPGTPKALLVSPAAKLAMNPMAMKPENKL